jgi:hypothetical protein
MMQDWRVQLGALFVLLVLVSLSLRIIRDSFKQATALLVAALTQPLAAIAAGILRVEVITNRLEARSAGVSSLQGHCVSCGQLTEHACVDCAAKDHTTFLCPRVECRTDHDVHPETSLSFRTTQPGRPQMVRR